MKSHTRRISAHQGIEVIVRTAANFACLVTVFSLSGCAIHFDVKEPAVPTDELQRFTIGNSISDLRQIRSSWLASGGVLVGVASDKADRDATIAFVVGAIAGGVAGMPVAESIALQGNLESSELARLPHSTEYGMTAAINVPEIFASAVKERSGVAHVVKSERPGDGIHITPFAVLRATKTQKLYASCGFNVSRFVAGKQEYFYQYWMHSNDEVDVNELSTFTSSRFQRSTEQCFRVLLGIFDEHRSAKLNDKFESGTLMYYEDAGWRGMYFRDESRQAYLRYVPSLMEVYPFRVTFSYQSAARK
jgi:hypothetical protein